MVEEIDSGDPKETRTPVPFLERLQHRFRGFRWSKERPHALVQCRLCACKVSSFAKACPQCGDPWPAADIQPLDDSGSYLTRCPSCRTAVAKLAPACGSCGFPRPWAGPDHIPVLVARQLTGVVILTIGASLVWRFWSGDGIDDRSLTLAVSTLAGAMALRSIIP